MEGHFLLQEEEAMCSFLPVARPTSQALLAGPETEGQVEAARQCQATLNPCDQSLLECSLDSMFNT